MSLFYFFVLHFAIGMALLSHIFPFDDFSIFCCYVISGEIIMVRLAVEGNKK